MFHLIRLGLFSLICLCIPSGAFAQAHKIDCKKLETYAQRNFAASVTAVKGIQGSFTIDPQIASKFDKFTVIMMSEESALCRTYASSDEKTFSTQQYLDELAKLRSWQLQFVQVLPLAAAASDAKAAVAGKKAGSDPVLAKAESDLNGKLLDIVSNPIKASTPKQ